MKWSRLSQAIRDEDKLSRRIKKQYLGRKMNKSDLRKLLLSVVVIPANNGYDMATILPYQFCPKCGCTATRYVDHGASYPERWASTYCVRCNWKLSTSDNSPFYHCLEYPDFNYELP